MRRWSLGFLFFLLGQIGFAADYTNYVRLFSFGGENGATPVGDLIEGSDGKLYGTTAEGGLTNGSFPNGMGVVFSLNKDGSGFSVLHRFADDGQDGQSPYGGLVEGTNGEFYGTTRNGGTAGGGTVFTINTKVSSYAVLKSVT